METNFTIASVFRQHALIRLMRGITPHFEGERTQFGTTNESKNNIKRNQKIDYYVLTIHRTQMRTSREKDHRE